MTASPPLPTRVFLTGGTGLAGSHVAERLRGAGVQVRALHRTSSDVRHLASLECELVVGDVRDDPEELARAMEGCDGLVHAASLVYVELPWPRVRAVNVDGTEGVFRAAGAAGIRRAVHLSSVAVYGLPEGEVDESFPSDRPLRPGERYARSKREAERVVVEASGDVDVEVAVLRPVALYGERDRLFSVRVARQLLRPIQLLLGSGRTPLPVLYAGNLAAAVEAALSRPLVPRLRVFNVGGDFPTSQRDLYRGLGEALGRRPVCVPIPGALVRGAARTAEAAGLGSPGMTEMSFRRAALLATRPNPFRSDRIRDELGWVPPIGLRDALFRTGRWLAEARPHEREGSAR